MRVVICEDHALLREGLVALLRENDVEVVGVAEDAERMLRLVERVEPDVLICDVRLPPGFRDEGIRAAIMARRAGVIDQVDATRIVVRATEDLELGDAGVA